jgi:chromosome segregation ATPase
VANSQKMLKDLLEVELLITEAKSDHKRLEDRNKEVNDQIKVRKKELEDATQLASKLKEHVLRQGERTVELENSFTDEEREIQVDFENQLRANNIISGALRTADLEGEITSLSQRLQLVATGNPRVIEEYEKRAREIANYESRVENFDAEIESRAALIDEIRAKWEPDLEEMISKVSEAFSYNFAQIKCAGEVQVYKDEEDFSEWAIHIKVKFR